MAPMRKYSSFFLVLALWLQCLSLNGVAGASDDGVAVVEEITLYPDGSQQVERYKPGQKPAPYVIQGPAQPVAPKRRGINRIEKEELNRLEMAFNFGEISETEYNQRKRQIYRNTFIGDPPDDGLFTQHGSF
jgi:hypothetical protein